MKLEIYQDTAKGWRWRFRARNGRLVASSGQSFKGRASSLRAASTLAKKMVAAVASAEGVKIAAVKKPKKKRAAR